MHGAGFCGPSPAVVSHQGPSLNRCAPIGLRLVWVDPLFPFESHLGGSLTVAGTCTALSGTTGGSAGPCKTGGRGLLF